MKINAEKEKELLEEVAHIKSEVSGTWDRVFTVLKEDFDFYLGNQWDPETEARARDAGIIPITINTVKKQVDNLCGRQRVNRNEVKGRPREKGDVTTAEIISRLVSFVQNGTNYDHFLSDAFKDAAVCGIGWLNIYPDFTRDEENGDLVVKRVSPLEVSIDPHCQEKDLSDATYLRREKIVHKDRVKMLYPDKKDEIDREKGYAFTGGTDLFESVPSDKGEHLKLYEIWHRGEDKQEVIVFPDGRTANVEDLTPAEYDAMVEREEAFELRKMTQERMFLTIATDNTVLYHGKAPYGIDQFPYIPVWGYVSPSHPDWSSRFQGVVRSLKDIQREQNTRRTQIVEIVRRKIQQGYLYKEGSIDPHVWANAPKVGGLLPWRGETPPTEMQTAPLDPMLVEMEKLAVEEFGLVGVRGDVVGETQEAGASGKVMKERQEAAVMSFQELFDNLGYANVLASKVIIGIISANFSIEKIKRILGEETVFNTRPLEEQLVQMQKEYEPPQNLVSQLLGMQQAYDQTGDEQIADQIIGIQQQIQQRQMQISGQIEGLQKEIEDIKARERDFWAGFRAMEMALHYDIILDNVRNNPTYRAQALQALQEAAHYNMLQPPPEALIPLYDLPEDVATIMLQAIAAQKQAMAKEAELEAKVKEADAMAKFAAAQYKMSQLNTESVKIQSEIEKQKTEREKRVDGSVS